MAAQSSLKVPYPSAKPVSGRYHRPFVRPGIANSGRLLRKPLAYATPAPLGEPRPFSLPSGVHLQAERQWLGEGTDIAMPPSPAKGKEQILGARPARRLAKSGQQQMGPR
jgi:hypothetical protein